MQEATIIYEQPLNEYIRVCLRLEHLFNQVMHNLQGQTAWECRAALWAMLEALNVIDRPDLKTKLTKALSQHASTLAKLGEKPQVDKQKLQEVLVELDTLVSSLYQMQDKMVYSLRENNFLTSIRQHMSNPGGACGFNTPAYELWLQKSATERNQNLAMWFKEFDHLRSVVTLLLQLTRGSVKPQELTAVQGFYQQALDPNLPCQLVRLYVPVHLDVYPEISLGRHRLSIRFYDLSIYGRATQTTKTVDFKLEVCVI